MSLAVMTSRALQIGQVSTEEGGTGALIENPKHVQSSMAINEIKFEFNFKEDGLSPKFNVRISGYSVY